MLGTGLNFGRARGEDQFYSPAKARRSFHTIENDKLRRAHSDINSTRSVRDMSGDAGNGVPDNRVVPEEARNAGAVSSCEPVPSRLSNLERFLQAITPSVHAQYLPKRTSRGRRACDAEFQPYFDLGDLWESFREWSAYGAGVPLVLNDKDSVVQYYVPYLSGIQIFSQNVKTPVKSRQLGEDSDSDFRDSSSDGSSDCEPVRERGLKTREQSNVPHLSDEIPQWMGGLSLRDHHPLPQDGFSSDDGEFGNSQGHLIFEYLERDPPYSREPLVDKITDLAFRFPELLTLRSCDILASSWISVAWYPIYRIPTGPTLKDLDACFLTYHHLYTPIGGSQRVQALMPHPAEMENIHKMFLPAFGLASYKFKGSLWTPNGGHEHQLASSLLEAADKWLRQLQVSHPDFQFFSRC